MNITERAEQFFEWPGKKTDMVTYTSALLFAEHCVREALRESDDLLTIARMQGRDIGRQQAARECVEIVSKMIHAPECKDNWSVTRTCAFVAVKEAIKAHFGLEATP